MANAIGNVEVFREGALCNAPAAAEAIHKETVNGRLGFKRKNVSR